MAHSKMTDRRPLSPHLQVYRLLINMAMSILHRITGATLYLGTLLVAWWLFAAAHSESYYNVALGIMGSWLGKLVLLGYTWAVLHHMFGGLRHLIWDTGRGFDLKTVNFLSWATIIASLATTAAIWLFAVGF